MAVGKLPRPQSLCRKVEHVTKLISHYLPESLVFAKGRKTKAKIIIPYNRTQQIKLCPERLVKETNSIDEKFDYGAFLGTCKGESVYEFHETPITLHPLEQTLMHYRFNRVFRPHQIHLGNN